MTSSGYYQHETHEEKPFERECDNLYCSFRGTLNEEWHDGSKWIKGRLWRHFNPMICTKCKEEFEENDRLVFEQEEFENQTERLLLTLETNN